MKYIELSQGKRAIVDDEDFEELNKYKWYFHHGYAIRKIAIWSEKKWQTIYMHRDIAQTPKDFFTDHINRDRLDNRKINLRICTYKDNSKNQSKKINNKSGFIGVHFKKSNKRWCAQISIDNKKTYLGLFDTPELAAMAFNKAAMKHYGEFAHLNKV